VAGSYVLFTQAAGYQNVTQNINFKTLQGTSKNLNEPVVISISFKQLKKGDYIEFTHVRFFKDASILQPGSEDELRGLADLMKENARYKIKIHAHCNGKADREATLMGTSTQYFATDSGNEKKTISAKQLTAARAEAVKNYLISQGVEGSRIGTMAEGGRIPLYPETGNTSQFNDRAEIEVVRR
jgi:outer membrane protein OmpA-like peptidoglycan-associated protein